jgi:hypothetical protein
MIAVVQEGSTVRTRATPAAARVCRSLRDVRQVSASVLAARVAGGAFGGFALATSLWFVIAGVTGLFGRLVEALARLIITGDRL